ncbi:hypothetical protein ACTNBL_04950 [Enterococcus villorum]|uniref:Gram-positive cocci surface proteins LPxTG domain-containing protein n=2 Tax=Enterococcus villorum TaxID=112904 RepID=A0A511J6B4_9ENTE|nr:hypothetical protein [Enterococcus villorum]EOH92303.1 hypothetical protein UAO_00456 [Enterococcus villorum ATCC 700913]EOW75672.1 hypothetical protein I591_02765 [Enterococcus villorum ATCC 700913]GEL93229.1 hypothetical protein EVI01_25660 [Enterococcus villorum]
MKNKHLKKMIITGTVIFSSMWSLTTHAADYTDTEGVIKSYDTTKLTNAVNENEKAILDELREAVNLNGKSFSFTASELNAAENYFKTVEIESTNAQQAIHEIKEAKKLFSQQTEVNVSNTTTVHSAVKKMKTDVIKKLMNHVIKVGDLLGLTVVFDDAGKAYLTRNKEASMTITDKEGNIIYQSGSPVKQTGTDLSNVVLASSTSIVLLGVAGFLFKKKSEK